VKHRLYNEDIIFLRAYYGQTK